MKCHNCGTELRASARFCDECGEKQGPARQAIFTEREIAEIQTEAQTDEYAREVAKLVEDGITIERRDVAVLFVDVSGFTLMFSSLEPGQMRDVMRDVYSVMSGAITRCGGYVDKFIGDEVMAIFGAPIALERPCERAITAVDEIAIGLAGVNHRFRDILPKPLLIHAGVAFGAVETGKLGDMHKLEYTILGETVNLAKRLTDLAPSESVFVTSEVEKLAREAFEFVRLGPLEIAGATEPVETFRLAGPRPVAGERALFSELGASMFGRHAELSSLNDAFGRLMSRHPGPKPCGDGEAAYRDSSHIFGITGEAGIGKSRLKREFRDHLRKLVGADGLRFLPGRSWAIGQTPLYWPVKEQIASALGFEMTADPQTISARLSRLESEKLLGSEFVPYLYYLFGLKYADDPLSLLEPKTIKDNLWIAVRRLFEGLSRQSPLVLVFEDMHWTDGGTSDFIDYLADFVSDFPVLILLLYRPGYEPTWAKRGNVPFTELGLQPLSQEAETDLLSFYLADGDAERALIRRIRRYSEGNPLFAEEFLHMLLERGILEQRAGKMRLREHLERIPMPTGLSGVLGERFDRLPRRDKQVAYYAAVIGRSFLHSLLSGLHASLHGSPDVQDALVTLLSREIIFERAIEPELEYVFKHAVTREILVSRLVESLRRELSKLIAMRTEETYQDRLEAFHGMLSEHWEVAGELEKAARHAAFSGIYSQKQQRNFEAQAAFERYDELCEHVQGAVLSPEEHKNLLLSRCEVLTVMGQWDEAIRLCQTLASLEGQKWRGIALENEAWLRYVMGDFARSLAVAQESLETARRDGDRKREASSLTRVGVVYDRQADYERAHQCYEQALAIARELRDEAGVATALANIGILFKQQGRYEEALRYYHESLAIDQRIGRRRFVAKSLSNVGRVLNSQGEHEQALRYHNESLAIKRALGDRPGISASLLGIAAVHWNRGDYEETLRCLQQALPIKQSLGDRLGLAAILNNMGGVHRVRGEDDQALRDFAEALVIYRELGTLTEMVFPLNNVAEVHLDKQEWGKAKEAASEAAEISRSIGARASLSTSLSLLCRAEAAMANWKASLSCGSEALSIADEVGSQEQMHRSRTALSEANVRIARWCDGKHEGEQPPLSRDEALAKATDYAQEAKELAEAKGIEHSVKQADELLAQIEALKAHPLDA